MAQHPNPLFDESLRGIAKKTRLGRAAMAFVKIETNSAMLRDAIRRGAPDAIADAYTWLCTAFADAIERLGAAQWTIDAHLGKKRTLRLTLLVRKLAALVHPVRLGADGLGLVRGATIPPQYWTLIERLGAERLALVAAMDLARLRSGSGTKKAQTERRKRRGSKPDKATRAGNAPVFDPVPLVWLRQVVPARIVKGDPSKLGAWLTRRRVAVFKIGGKLHAERAELLDAKALGKFRTVAALIRDFTP